MTKVWMSPYFLEYQMAMKDALRQVIQENYIGGVRESEWEVPVLDHTVSKAVSPARAGSPTGRDGLRDEHLLPPPRIMCLSLQAYEGQQDDFIGIVVHHDFGIHAMHITILDEDGNRIECGDASLFSYGPELWEYLPAARVPAGTAVTVHVTVMDCMGGIGRWWESKTLGV